MIEETKREKLSWARLKRGPDEEDEVITETKRDAGEWTRLKKGTAGIFGANLRNNNNNSDDGARTKKGRERARAVISFFDWARLKRGLGSWMMMKRSDLEEDGGWIRMM